MGRLALTADVDMRRLAEAGGAAALALSAHQGHTQQQLVDALLRLEHGGAAYALLYTRTNNLWAPVVAHTVTNAILGVWIVATGSWHLW